MRILDLRVGYTPREARGAEVLKQAFEVEFAEALEVEALPANPEVTKAVRLLMNARARREAVAHMDRGDYAASVNVLAGARAATLAYCAAQPADEETRAESEDLLRVTGSLADRGRDRISRKLLEYSSLLRRTGRKTS
jgi:regulator of protease activity HflC (stomatin/prohibitin superfamily)